MPLIENLPTTTGQEKPVREKWSLAEQPLLPPVWLKQGEPSTVIWLDPGPTRPGLPPPLQPKMQLSAHPESPAGASKGLCRTLEAELLHIFWAPGVKPEDAGELLLALQFLQEATVAEPQLALTIREQWVRCRQYWSLHLPPSRRRCLEDKTVLNPLISLVNVTAARPRLGQVLWEAREVRMKSRDEATIRALPKGRHPVDPESLTDWLDFAQLHPEQAICNLLARLPAGAELEFLCQPKTARKKLMYDEFIEVWQVLAEKPNLAELLVRRPELITELKVSAEPDLQLLQQEFPGCQSGIAAQADSLALLRQDRQLFFFLLQNPGVLEEVDWRLERDRERVRLALAPQFSWAREAEAWPHHNWQCSLLAELAKPGPAKLFTNLHADFNEAKQDILEASWGQPPDINLLQEHWRRRYGSVPENWRSLVGTALLHTDSEFAGSSEPALLAVPEHRPALARLVQLPYGLAAAEQVFQAVRESDESADKIDAVRSWQVLPGYGARGRLTYYAHARQLAGDLKTIARQEPNTSGPVPAPATAAAPVPVLAPTPAHAHTPAPAQEGLEISYLHWGVLQTVLARLQATPLLAGEPHVFAPIFADLPQIHWANLESRLDALPQGKQLADKVEAWLYCPNVRRVIAAWHWQTGASWPQCLAGLVAALNQANRTYQQLEKRPVTAEENLFACKVPSCYRLRLLAMLGHYWYETKGEFKAGVKRLRRWWAGEGTTK